MAQPVIIIDDTIGGLATNSFLSLVDAEALVHQHPFHSSWDKIIDDDEKNAALVWSTRILSHYKWKGVLASQTQKLPWPRKEVYDLDNRELPSDQYPEWLLVACAELAFYLATEDRLGDTGTEGFSKIKIEGIDLTIDKFDRQSWIPNYLIKAITPWLSGSASVIVSRV